MKKIILAVSTIVIVSCAAPQNKGNTNLTTEEKIQHIVADKEKAQMIYKILEEEKKKVEDKYIENHNTYKEEKIKEITSLIKEPITPVKTPDTIIRAYILPYVDDSKVFHSGEYVFIKVDEGRWVFDRLAGSSQVKDSKVVNPLQEESN